MKLFSVSIVACSILFCSKFVTVQAECNKPGTISGATCVTKNSFFLSFQNPSTDEPMNCPEGEVCADIREICSPTATPVCKNTKPGDLAACNECIDEKLGSPVCINKNEYSICNSGILQNKAFKCPSTTPYCKVTFDDLGDYKGVCGFDPSKFDCPDDPAGGTNSTNGGDGGNDGGDGGTNGGNNGTSTTTTAPPQPFKCTVAGFFADPSSLDCRSYIKCQAKSQGGFDELKFTCSTAGTAFNPATQRCETGYNCV